MKLELRYNTEVHDVEIVNADSDEVIDSVGADVVSSWVEAWTEAHKPEPVVEEPAPEPVETELDALKRENEELRARLEAKPVEEPVAE